MRRVRLPIVSALLFVSLFLATMAGSTRVSARPEPKATNTTELVIQAATNKAKLAAKATSTTTTLPPTERTEAYRWARSQMGKWYCWGGTGPSCYDCSGLMMEAYRHVGIYLPRDTFSMLASSQLIWERHRDAKKGDLAFFGPGHVEMFISGNTTLGAQTFGTTVGYHQWNAWWHPTEFYRVRGARARP